MRKALLPLLFAALMLSSSSTLPGASYEKAHQKMLSEIEEDTRRTAAPIGYGQTISQPYIVALMTDLLALGADAKVLEVGTGSGYQAAVLAEMGAQVFTIEIIPELGRQVADRFEALEFKAIRRFKAVNFAVIRATCARQGL